MTHQIRSYRIKDGKMDEWLREWRDVVCPLRRKYGFTVVGAWADREEHRFLWIVRHDGDLASEDARYHSAPERAALDPNPARHVERAETWLASAVTDDG
ncbi:MAG: NIPSNAP family protein [Actinomycetota bacterium]